MEKKKIKNKKHQFVKPNSKTFFTPKKGEIKKVFKNYLLFLLKISIKNSMLNVQRIKKVVAYMNNAQKIFFIKLYKFPFSRELTLSESVILSILFEKAKDDPEVRFTRKRLKQIIPAGLSDAVIRKTCRKLQAKKIIKFSAGSGRGHSTKFTVNTAYIQDSFKN